MGWIIVVVASVVISLWRLSPPAQDVGGFSTDAALKHLRFIAAEIHPVGSPFHSQARDYLIRQFRELGYDVRTQDARVPLDYFTHEGPRLSISNIIASKAGTGPDRRAVMLCAHYDSARLAPGAGDDGAAVCALLEVARILSTQPHRNELIFLVTDAEELGLLGAREFVAKDPAARDVGVVLNFDARGTSGPSVMFETSDDNAWLINFYARYAPHPVCSSLSYDLYKHMPNNTDFTIFRHAGMQGLNFAFIGTYANYHTPNDDLDHLDIRSLRHDGIQALNLVGPALEADLSQSASKGNDVYWDVLSLFVARYPQDFALPLAIGTAIGAMATVVFAAMRRSISFGHTLISAVVLFVNVAIVLGVCWSTVYLTHRVNLAIHANLVILGYILLTLAITFGCFAIFRRLSSGNLWAAGLVVWAVLAIVTAMLLPGGSYLTAWPLLCSTIAFGLYRTPMERRLRIALVLLLCIPSITLIAPIIYLAFLGLTVSAAWLLVPLVVLTLWLLPPMWSAPAIAPNTFQK